MPILTILLFLATIAFAQTDSSSASDSLESATADSGHIDAAAEADSIAGVDEEDVPVAGQGGGDSTLTASTGGRGDAMQKPAVQPFSLPQAKKPPVLHRMTRPVAALLREIGVVTFLRRYGMRTLVLIVSFGLIGAAAWVLMQKADRRRFMTTTRLSIMDKEVQKACRFIERNYGDSNLNIDTICEELVTGPAFLESLFQRELGMSVMGFLAQVRVNRIKLALEKEPAHSLEELVLLTGFRDADELKETFRQTAGIALVDYRKSLSTEQTYAS